MSTPAPRGLPKLKPGSEGAAVTALKHGLHAALGSDAVCNVSLPRWGNATSRDVAIFMYQHGISIGRMGAGPRLWARIWPFIPADQQAILRSLTT